MHEKVGLYIPDCGDLPQVLPDGEVVLSDAGSGAPLCVFSGDDFYFAFDPALSIRAVLEEKYFKHSKNPFMKAPIHYHMIPGAARMAASKVLYGKWNGAERDGFPAWPLELSVDVFRYALKKCVGGREGISMLVDWPDNKKFCVIISHDIDTVDGVRGAEKIAALESARGVTSCWCVPYSVMVKNRSFIDKLINDGHEVAVHGYNHDNRIAHIPEREMNERIRLCADAAREIGANGFRSPSLIVSDELYSALQGKFSWSSSVIDSDVNSIIGARRGCATVFPFYRGDVLEIPVTVPFEDRFIIMGYSPDEIVEVQIAKIGRVAEMGGVVMYANHTERHLSGDEKYLAVYEKVLDNILSMEGAWFASPSELETFWRGRFPLKS